MSSRDSSLRRRWSGLVVVVGLVGSGCGTGVGLGSGDDADAEPAAPTTEPAEFTDDDLDLERDDLPPMEGQAIRVVDEDSDLIFTLPRSGVSRSQSGQVRTYSLTTGAPAAEVGFLDIEVDASLGGDAAAHRQSRLDNEWQMTEEEPVTADGQPGTRTRYAASGVLFDRVEWVVDRPGGGFVAIRENLVEGESVTLGPAVLESIRFDVGYRSGPWFVRAPAGADPRPHVTTEPSTGISFPLSEQASTSRTVASDGADLYQTWRAPLPGRRDRGWEQVRIGPGPAGATVDEILRQSVIGRNIEVIDTATDIEVDGRPGRGGHALFEGSIHDPPAAESVWVVPLEGGFLVLSSWVEGDLASPPPALDDLAATVKIPEGATVTAEVFR